MQEQRSGATGVFNATATDVGQNPNPVAVAKRGNAETRNSLGQESNRAGCGIYLGFHEQTTRRPGALKRAKRVVCIASVVVGDFAARVPWIVGTELKQTPGTGTASHLFLNPTSLDYI